MNEKNNQQKLRKMLHYLSTSHVYTVVSHVFSERILARM